MKFLLSFLIFSLLCASSFAQNCETLRQEAWYLFYMKKYDKSLSTFQKMEKNINTCMNRKDYYRMAYCAMAKENPPECLHYLTKAAEKGLRFKNKEILAIRKDTVIKYLSKHFATDKIEQQVKNNTKNFELAVNQKLRIEVQKMAASDQKYRNVAEKLRKQNKLTKVAWDSLMNLQRKWDSLNTLKLQQIIETHGFPGYQLVGYAGADIACQIAQHSRDTVFQNTFLGMMRKAVEDLDYAPENLAFMEDMMLVSKGKLQKYGTQFGCFNGAEECIIQPIEDIENVDKRRIMRELPPLDPAYKVPNAKMKR